MFLSDAARSMGEGSIIEVSVTSPDGRKITTNMKVNQEDLARDLGVDRVRITQMIQNLLDEKLLSIDYRAKSRNTSFMYNVYLLNY